MGSMDNGDRPRSNAIAVSPVAPSIDDPSIPTLGTVVVTADPMQNEWFMSMWDWSNQYHMAPPPTDGSRASLVRYQNQMTQQLAPAYDQYIRQSYAGMTVSAVQGQDFNSVWANQPTNKVVATGAGIVAGLGKAMFDTVAGTVKLTGDILGAAAYERSGGLVGQTQYESLGQAAAGVMQLISHPIDTVGGAIGGWYDNTTAALNRGDYFAYGMQVGEGATLAGTAIEGAASLGRRLANGAGIGAEALQAERLSATVSEWKDLGVVDVSHPMAGMTAADVLFHAKSLGLSAGRDNLLLWSGIGPTRYAVARSQAYASEFGGTTLEMTPGGKWLNESLYSKNSPFSQIEADLIFADASRLLAQQASGQVRVLLGWIQPKSIYRKIELPALQSNPNITGIDEIYLKSKYGIMGE